MEEKRMTGGSTTHLKRILGFGDLMGVAFGYIIGAGIMTLLGSAIAMTGRSVPFAFIIAALITIFQFMPTIVTAGTVRLRGGNYTMVAMLCGDKVAGAYTVIFMFQSMSLAMFALSFGSYFCSLFGIESVLVEKIAGFIPMTLLFIMNLFGVDKFAKTQRIIVTTLITSLALFAAFGIFHIQPDYFAPESFLTGGVLGLFQAAGMLTFAIGGGAGVVNLSAEAKNPTRDIPLVAIISTLVVALIYAIVGFVGAGVLPVEEVAGQNLTVVAQVVMPRPVYLFFVVFGVCLALISPMNAQFASAPKPVMQMCDDGWFPEKLAKVSSLGSPYIIQTILYVLGFAALFTGLSVSTLVNLSIVAGGAMNILMNLGVMRLPQVCPEAWEASRFKMPKPLLTLICLGGAGASAFNVYVNASSLPGHLILLNVVVVTFSFIYGALRSKTAHVQVSYEQA